MENVVLLHCSGSSGAQWRALAGQLGTRYRVAAPDLAAYGTLAQAAAALQLHEPIHLVGHSYGGALALHIARTRPEIVRSLTLVEPSAFHLLRNGDVIDAAALREIEAVAADTKIAGMGRFVDYWSGPGTWAAMPPEKRAALAPQIDSIMLDFRALLGEPAGILDMCAIATPTLIVQGGCTTLPSRCICARLRTALPDAFFRVVQGAGHMLPITHREAVNALISNFVQQGANHEVHAG